ncbi:MAG: hypothetical protein HFJ37_02115 [Clostridia bacterium]|nr:hypothetical protein [Clostridia bacterium]
MLVMNQKRIKIMLTCILIALFAFSLQITNENPSINNRKETVQTTATPVSGKTVVLDAGHGIPEKGSCLLTPIK